MKKSNIWQGIVAVLFVLSMILVGHSMSFRQIYITDVQQSDFTMSGSTLLSNPPFVAGVSANLSIDEVVLNSLSQQVITKADEAKMDATQEESEYSDFAIANVDKYVNVRIEPSVDSQIVGRMYDGAVAQVQETVECEDGDWLQVISGQVQGYIKAQYFIYGDDAARVIDDYVDRYALVNADRLNIREEPDVQSKRIGYAQNGEKLKLSYGPLENEEWVYVEYVNDKKGYVSAEYVTVFEEFIYARTIEEIREKEEQERDLQRRQQEDEQATPEMVDQSEQQATSIVYYSPSGDIRADVVSYAMQYVGYPYVHGGNSLETGTDCSGFTSLVYAQFGVGLSRTPSGQLSSNGRSISLEEAQPGDIVCYGHGKCSHVALYIGDGQIVHAANPRKGVVVYNVGYDNILGVKNVID